MTRLERVFVRLLQLPSAVVFWLGLSTEMEWG